MPLEKAVYTAKAKATGGRDGRATSSDEVLDVKLAAPIQNNFLQQVIQPVSSVQ